jgi:hypothetical protein
MLIASRKPGPRAKHLDLPTISYASEYKGLGYPIYKHVCMFYFRCSDVEMLARVVHGDVEEHLERKEAELEVRRAKAKRKRVKKFKIEHHQFMIEHRSGSIERHTEGTYA